MEKLRKTDIQYLHGVGPKRAELLAKQLDIRSYFDLLYYFPFRYIDKSKIHHIAEIEADMPYIQIRGHFINAQVNGEGARRRLNAAFTDGTGVIDLVWFNRVRSIEDSIRYGVDYIIFGKPTLYNGRFSIAHPEMDIYKPDMEMKGFLGVYTLTDTLRNRGFSTRTMQTLVQNLFQAVAVNTIPETLPRYIIDRHHLMPLGEALLNMHLPQSVDALREARRRMKYEELFYLQLNILRYAMSRSTRVAGHTCSRVGEKFNSFYNNALPFPLTGAQKRVIKEIRKDMGSGRQMNRLLQGDVGSGKTLVAFMVMLLAIDNNLQACIMAPTEILASQHFQTISEMAEKIGVTVALLTGSTRKKERDRIHASLLDGSLNILIGTHAVIEDNVAFNNLGVVVIDEQHRFGVAQRAKLWKKNSVPPHVLVMTATPIPRTLAMTVYGDLDVSVIDELPPGRKPVTTVLRTDDERMAVYQFMGEQLRAGRQIYVVYPLIQENEKLDLKNLEEGYQAIQETFPSYRVCFVHGKMKPAEKDYQMKIFASHEAHIMVATTVIEVGVNVPNASVMVIENAERFGLSQLHQLRGRVGRGAAQSFCILMSKHQLAKDTRHRLKVMTQTNDGFVVAEEDMKLRGPGDMEGTQQSGVAFSLRVTDLAHDGMILEEARSDAREILSRDLQLSHPDNALLSRNLHLLFDRQFNWGVIS